MIVVINTGRGQSIQVIQVIHTYNQTNNNASVLENSKDEKQTDLTVNKRI